MAPHILLSPFQVEKLEYYFRFLEPNEEGNLDGDSVERLMQRIIKFTGWNSGERIVTECREVHEAFFEILIERARQEGEKQNQVSLEMWFSLWSGMLPGVMAISNLPVWLRLMPKILFDIIDRQRNKKLSAEDLADFYREMGGMDASTAAKVADKAYEQMTDGGRYPLDVDSYEQLFANFLIGRTPYGPGRYIFGCFEHKVQPFTLITPAPEEDDDIAVEIQRPPPGRRPSRTHIMTSS